MVDQRWIPVAVVIAFVFVALVVVLARHVFPVKHTPGDFSGPDPELPPPRPVQPTLPEIDETPAPVALPPAPEPPDPVVEVGLAELDDASPAVLEPPRACGACGEPIEQESIAVEDWERVDRFWDRFTGKTRTFLQFLGMVRRDRRRELYESHGFCRSCAALAQPLHRARKATLAAERLAEDRQWERVGLCDAVRQTIEDEGKRYTERRARAKNRGF